MTTHLFDTTSLSLGTYLRAECIGESAHYEAFQGTGAQNYHVLDTIQVSFARNGSTPGFHLRSHIGRQTSLLNAANTIISAFD